MRMKYLYVILVAILVAGSFWAGIQYNSRRPRSATLPSGNGSAIVDTNTGNEADIEGGKGADTSIPSDAITISPERQQLIGVRTDVAEKRVVTRKFRLLGRVAADETRLYKIKTAVEGVIREVYPSTTGSVVKEGQPLASYYSPDIYAAEQGYLIAVSSDRHRSGLQVQVTRSRLQFLGMSASQIDELEKKGEIEEKIVLRSPATGFVLSRNVSPDLRFQKGEELYRIAALDRVWIFADIYETEGRYVRPNVIADIFHPLLGKALQARVSKVLPLFDAATRTFQVRLEADNPGFILRPDMFVDIELPMKMSPAVVVPSEAIIFSGLKKTVFVDLGNGYFEPREVQTGRRLGNNIEITNGLKPGERFVISGNFLIDSESKLRGTGLGNSKSDAPGQAAGSSP